MAVALLAGALACAPAAASAAPTATVAVLPLGTSAEQLARVPRLAIGVMSAGIGSIPAEQTYLDISQGNRVSGPLYDLPLRGNWPAIVGRAQEAPADLVPGLLASTLVEHGVPVRADPSLRAASVIATDRDGLTRRGSAGQGLRVIPATVGSLAALTEHLRGNDLLIAFAQPPPAEHGTLALGIAGAGFRGDLTSASTRTDGYVLSTDIAPTILRRFGLRVPDQMDGEPIRAEGNVDPATVQDRADRMAAVPDRRAPILISCLLAWIAVAAGLALLGRSRGALAWLALAVAYLPLLLLVGAAIQPSAIVEGLLIGLGAAALAAITLRMVRGWWALAVACSITVAAYAVDMFTGSELTKLSLLGPNPVFGARFYGIGNELEALLAVMVPAAVGAGLTAARSGPRRGIAAFLVAGFAAAIVFGAGRFGADVGAAIVLPVGAVVAAAAVPAGARSTGWILTAVVAVPFIALGFLALIDLVSGGNAHLTRSVLHLGGSGLADAAQRRLELNAHEFRSAATSPLFWVLIVGVALAISQWRRIDEWLRPTPAARAGLIGACAAVIAGTLANDSGAAYLALGAIAIGAFLAFAWAQAPRARKYA